MPKLTYKYVYYSISGAHTRQPRATNSSGFTPIPGLNSGGTATLQTGTQFQAISADPTHIANNVTYSFAFMSVSGCVEGGQVSFDCTTPPPAGTVGTADVTVLVVYLPPGCGNGNGSGATIDAFDETTGNLVDDTFVTVSTNGSPDNPLTNSGNVDGYVDTTSNDETITALAYITPTGANFDKWRILNSGLTSPSGLAMIVKKGNSTNALAFYKRPNKFQKENILKEHIKELDKVFFKESSFKVPQKLLGDKFKDAKDMVEGGSFGNVGDPFYLIGDQLQKLNQKIADLETKLATLEKGKAFIKSEDRPAVGKTIAKKQNEPT